MEIAILILVITSLLILGATCFFSFQIWIQSKELKINISSMNDEIKKINTELNSNLNSKINLIQNIISEELEKICKKMQELNDQNIKLENNIGNTKNFLNEQVEIKLKSSEKKIIDSFNSHGFSLENTITEQNMKLEKVIEKQTESLSGSNKTLKHSIENQMKEIDDKLNIKLVNDLNQLIENTNNETKKIVNEVLSKFDKTAGDIEVRQKTLLKAITEPLSITPNNYD